MAKRRRPVASCAYARVVISSSWETGCWLLRAAKLRRRSGSKCLQSLVLKISQEASRSTPRSQLYKRRGAVPVLPWGVGKWSGERGRLVANAAARYSLLLGDNAGRPFGWPRPALFQQYVVLPGTDPLWLKTEQERVGTYGFVLEGHFDSDRPAAGVVNALQNLTQSPPVFGNRVGPYGFLRQQLGLRFSR